MSKEGGYQTQIFIPCPFAYEESREVQAANYEVL